jgi:hypothetical protein
MNMDIFAIIYPRAGKHKEHESAVPTYALRRVYSYEDKQWVVASKKDQHTQWFAKSMREIPKELQKEIIQQSTGRVFELSAENITGYVLIPFGGYVAYDCPRGFTLHPDGYSPLVTDPTLGLENQKVFIPGW